MMNKLLKNQPPYFSIKILTTLLFMVMVITVILLFGDFGITWDEPVHHRYGDSVLRYYESGFQDQSALNKKHYGGFFDTLSALFIRLLPIGEYEIGHLINGLFGLLGILGTWKLTKTLSTSFASFMAALLLFLIPSYFGHMFNNPKDIPFAVGYIWSLYYLVLFIHHIPLIPPRLVIKLGIAIGVTLGIRIGGLLLYCYIYLIITLYWIIQSRLKIDMSKNPSNIRKLKNTLLPVIGISIISYIVMLVFWPAAHLNPFSSPIKTLSAVSNFQWKYTTLFDGKYISGKEIPYYYLPKLFLIKIPESILILLITSLFLFIYKACFKRTLRLNRTFCQYSLLIFAIFFPLSYSMIKKVVLYDEIRHFIFIIPCLATLCGITLNQLYSLFSNKKLILRKLFILMIFTFVIIQTRSLIRLHPYQSIYYNTFIGGPVGAEGQYELDYWATSYREAVIQLSTFLKSNDSHFENNNYSIFVNGPPMSAVYYFPNNFHFVTDIENGDFAISFTRWNLHRSLPGKKIIEIKQAGVLLSVIHAL